MSIGLIGRKCGMTRIFTEEGVAIPVTVIEVAPNHITQIKTLEQDGYQALQITTGKRKPSRVNKPSAGHFAKAKVEPGRGLWEFRFEGELPVFNQISPASSEEAKETEEATAADPETRQRVAEVGHEVPLTLFEAGQLVDVTGKSKGKGFAGVIKRHNFATQDATHGNSLSHRAPGSIGQNQSPGRVFKGKKMAGQMGNVRKTIQSLEIIRIDEVRRLILVKGAVPGATGGDVIVRPAVKVHRKEEKV